MKYLLCLLLSLVGLGAGCTNPIAPAPRPVPVPIPGPVACTADAKQCPDGSYVGRTGPNCEFVCPPAAPGVEGRSCNGIADKGCGAGYECTQECGPPVVRDTDPAPGYSCHVAGQPRMCPICLAASTLIGTPKGDVNVKDIREGMMVWTMKRDGNKVAMPVLKVTKTLVSKTHRIVHLKLSDGREAWISPGHPTMDKRLIGALRAGDLYNGSTVLLAELAPYTDLATYDLLPSGETGTYWANSVLVGSTLY
ncbi:hypothetical protein K8R04_00540 [Candidatus Uhrbacteria bacterium]|nr:hypothetical protein [Candidatus Uhrbacteria bacterium]